jgi:hydroxymethylbilane synthase
VIAALCEAWPDLRIEVRVIRTEGDRRLDVTPDKLGKGAFVKEIEAALLAGEIDLAVHSCKDLPTDMVPELTLAAVPQRADPRDVLVSREGLVLEKLPRGAVVGTSSSRRRAQLLMQRPDLEVRDIRGNVDTRLRKLRGGQYDAVVLAAAGLARMGWLEQATQVLEPEVMLPAPGQGALAVQVRADDEATRHLVAAINHPPTHAAVLAERAFLQRLGGGCRVPIAAYARIRGGRLVLHGLVAAPDGVVSVRGRQEGPPEEAEEVGRALAEELLEQGAEVLVE